MGNPLSMIGNAWSGAKRALLPDSAREADLLRDVQILKQTPAGPARQALLANAAKKYSGASIDPAQFTETPTALEQAQTKAYGRYDNPSYVVPQLGDALYQMEMMPEADPAHPNHSDYQRRRQGILFQMDSVLGQPQGATPRGNRWSQSMQPSPMQGPTQGPTQMGARGLAGRPLVTHDMNTREKYVNGVRAGGGYAATGPGAWAQSMQVEPVQQQASPPVAVEPESVLPQQPQRGFGGSYSLDPTPQQYDAVESQGGVTDRNVEQVVKSQQAPKQVLSFVERAVSSYQRTPEYAEVVRQTGRQLRPSEISGEMKQYLARESGQNQRRLLNLIHRHGEYIVLEAISQQAPADPGL